MYERSMRKRIFAFAVSVCLQFSCVAFAGECHRPGFIPAEEKHRLRALENLFYFEFQAPNRFKTTILDGTADDLRWERVDGSVWVQT